MEHIQLKARQLRLQLPIKRDKEKQDVSFSTQVTPAWKGDLRRNSFQTVRRKPQMPEK